METARRGTATYDVCRTLTSGALSGTSARCNVDDAAEVPHETVNDPVLERSQRLFEETFAPSLGPRIGPGPGTDETLLRPRAEAPLDR